MDGKRMIEGKKDEEEKKKKEDEGRKNKTLISQILEGLLDKYIKPFCTGYNTSSPKMERSHQLHSIIPTNYRHHFMLSGCRRRGPVIYLLNSRGSVRL